MKYRAALAFDMRLYNCVLTSKSIVLLRWRVRRAPLMQAFGKPFPSK